MGRPYRQSLLWQTEWWPDPVWWICDTAAQGPRAWLLGCGLAIMVWLITCIATQQVISQAETEGLTCHQEINNPSTLVLGTSKDGEDQSVPGKNIRKCTYEGWKVKRKTSKRSSSFIRFVQNDVTCDSSFMTDGFQVKYGQGKETLSKGALVND